MALLEMGHTRILQSTIMEKWIDSLNIDSLIFQTLQYFVSGRHPPTEKSEPFNVIEWFVSSLEDPLVFVSTGFYAKYDKDAHIVSV